MSTGKRRYSVHKFGGSSLVDAKCLLALKGLLSGKNEVIVVSALQGVTSGLQDMLDDARTAASFSKTLAYLEDLHIGIINKLLADNNTMAISQSVRQDLSEIKDILHAVQLTGSYSREIQDLILGYGELWSARIISAYLGESGKTVFLDATEVLFKAEKNGMVCIDWLKSQTALDSFLKNKSFDQLVITGFIASNLDGRRSTLGRNGSDFSAAIFAKLLKAGSLTIWKDVDGIFTADPGRVPSAFVIEELSWKEALELAYFGTKALHPMTIAPVFDQKIPVRIKNSFNPQAKGTLVSESSRQSPYLVKGLGCIDNIALVNIEGAGMIGVSGVAARVFGILHQANISVVLIAQASSEYSICFAIANSHADEAISILHENLQFEIDRLQIEGIYADKNCAILSAVGDKMIGTIGVSGKLCSALARANVNIRAISQGSSERNISVVINSQDTNKALLAVHAGFYLSSKTIAIGLIGPGKVGSTLLEQIQQAKEQLESKYKVRLLVKGIMSSSKMLLSAESLALSDWSEACEVKPDLQAFMSHITGDDVPHAVIIDCTAEKSIAGAYAEFFEKGIHVITPNKHANAGDLRYYKQLKSLTDNKNTHYLYEATVCAGLPVINTLQDLIKTGDSIESIEGIVSGTLSYIFNEIAKNRSFSEAVSEAKRLGYTEPDPREDLSGMDVARKLVCLARETGFDVTLADVKIHNLVPEALKSCSVEEFMQKLPLYDKDMETLLAGKQAAYTGVIHQDGTMQVAIKAVQQNHPFARLKGTDNMLIFHTKRYHEQPLLIQGPGAGAEVTAAGIFADLLRLVSFLS